MRKIQAKRRLADEYDDAQERGEIRRAGNPNSSGGEELPGPKAIGLSHKDVHEARLIRDAEAADPGIVQRALRSRVERLSASEASEYRPGRIPPPARARSGAG